MLDGGRWSQDGGALFGVVPKVLWARHAPPDPDNMVELGCAAAVIRHRGRTIVCETGIGTKLTEKRASQVRLREPEMLLTGLQRLGIRPEEVDLVLTTHLHWDHAGGFTRRNRFGELEITFPRARHVVQAAEWEYALRPDVRSRSGYIQDDFLPIAEAGLLEVLHGDAELIPGLELRLSGGHTPGHQVILIRSGDSAVAMPGDLFPTRVHGRVAWNNPADLDVPTVLEAKRALLEDAARNRWLVILGHDPHTPAVRVGEDLGLVPSPEFDDAGTEV